MSVSLRCALAVVVSVGCGSPSTSPDASVDASVDALDDSNANTDAATDAGSACPWYDDIEATVVAYKAAHPGNGGKDWDINEKTPAQLAGDPDAVKLLALCPADQRPIIPLLAWEYGGADHPWIEPEASALVYCVYIPANPGTEHWTYDAVGDHVTADVYVKCPERNPCKDKVGADQVAGCIGDVTNFEILVDMASRNDGADVGLSLANA